MNGVEGRAAEAEAVEGSVEVAPPEAMLQLIAGFWVSRTIYVAASLRLADHLKDGPRTAAELAAATGTRADMLARVLRVLESVGVLARREGGRYELTPLGATLRSDVPGSLRGFAASELGEGHYQAWGEVLHSVRTGETAFEHFYGMPIWEYYAQRQDLAQTFQESMTSLTRVVEPAVLEAYDFSGFERVVDVGGGHGTLLASVLKRHTHLRGVLFDAPHVTEAARARLAAEGLDGRLEVASGSFFDAVPEGADAYMMKHIIHDWDDERAALILKNCRRAMREGGHLIVIDQVVPDGPEPSFGKFTDLLMMVMVGGKERTAAEFAALFDAAGFRLTRIIPTHSPMSIIEGRRQ